MNEGAPSVAPGGTGTKGRLEVRALRGLPRFRPGDGLAEAILGALGREEIVLRPHDVLAVTSKVFSRVEGRFVDLSSVEPSAEAIALAEEVEKDPALVELVLRDTVAISRRRPGALIVRHRLGFISANAAIDQSNAAPDDAPAGSGPWALTMPKDPDESARKLRHALERSTGVGPLGVVVTDSWGRPFRVGTVGTAVGVAGLPALSEEIGRQDLDRRPLEHTVVALADQVAAAADLVAGQADEGRPVILLRGLRFDPTDEGVGALLRDPEMDLYA